jgi:hypothetical protein
LAKKYMAESEDFELEFLDKYDPAKVDDPYTISKMKNVAAVLDRWSSAVSKQALKLAVEEGEQIPGYDVFYRKPTQSIPLGEAVNALVDHMDEDEILEACSTSLRVLGKIAAEKADRGNKARARADVEAALLREGVIKDTEDLPPSPYLRKNKK